MPIFHDPRPGSLMTRLPEKDKKKITHSSNAVHYVPKPGTLIFIPALHTHTNTELTMV